MARQLAQDIFVRKRRFSDRFQLPPELAQQPLLQSPTFRKDGIVDIGHISNTFPSTTELQQK